MTLNSDRLIKSKVKAKDSPLRSISKAISWRFIATGTTFLISFIIFHRYTEKTINESMENAGLIASIEFFAKILFYYLHERLWTNINWGKYWRRFYWGKRAWRKLYNQMHDKDSKINQKAN